MKKILVPTDFSPNAARAIDYAVQVARINQATIYIIHACELLDTSFKDRLDIKQEYNKTIANEAFAKLGMIRSSIEETEKLSVNVQLYNGPVTDTILLSAEEHGADLIIMGTLGITGFKDAIFGSKTAAIIGKTTIPLLAIPLEYDWSKPKKLLLAVNHFEEAADLAGPVFDFAGVFDAEVEVAVFTDNGESILVEYQQHSKEIIDLEEALHEKYGHAKIHHEHLVGHRFTQTLNDHISDKEIDLVAMITYKRNLIEGIFRRSMTKHMAYHTKVPLLVIPAST